MVQIIKENETVERYGAMFDVYANRLNGQRDTPYFKLRQDAMAKLRAVGFPKRKDEDYKYTNLTQLLSIPFQSPSPQKETAAELPGIVDDAIHIYFHNGRLDEAKSDLNALPDGIHILTIEDALKDPSLSDRVMAALEEIISEQTSAFTLLSVAFAQGIVCKVDTDTSITRPIQVIYESNISDDVKMMTAQLSLFFIESGANCQSIELGLGRGSDNTYFQNIYNRVYLEQNARLSMHRWQEESQQGHVISTTEVKQAKGSTFSHLTVDIGGKLIRNNVYATHEGEQVNTNLYGVYLAKGERQHIDNQTFIDHAKPHCLSNELYKGIVDNYSKAVFNGKVIVRPDAQKINAFQQNASLLLSDHARVDSKPQLEIFADDVKCSHGATIGQLDEQALYYLMTRGLPELTAKKMLQSAFLHEVFTDFDESPIVDAFVKKLQQHL